MADQNDFDEMLISSIEENPELYDKTMQEYKDDKLRENIWKKIAQNLQNTPERCQKRWDNLRTGFVRCYREQMYMLTDECKYITKPNFPYYEEMLWLAPFLGKIKNVTFTKTLPAYSLGRTNESFAKLTKSEEKLIQFQKK